jgi:hypothetical protein
MKKAILLTLLLLLAPVVSQADILLTVAELVRSEIGGTGTAAYDTIRTVSITVNPQDNTLFSRFELFVSADGSKPALSGEYQLDVASGVGTIRIERLGLETGVTLTQPQKDGIITNIDAHRDTTENSMVSFNMVDGTQQ